MLPEQGVTVGTDARTITEPRTPKQSRVESDPNFKLANGEAAARNGDATSPSSWPDTTRSPSVEKEHVMTFSHRLSFMYHGGCREGCGMAAESDYRGYNFRETS